MPCHPHRKKHYKTDRGTCKHNEEPERFQQRMSLGLVGRVGLVAILCRGNVSRSNQQVEPLSSFADRTPDANP